MKRNFWNGIESVIKVILNRQHRLRYKHQHLLKWSNGTWGNCIATGIPNHIPFRSVTVVKFQRQWISEIRPIAQPSLRLVINSNILSRPNNPPKFNGLRCYSRLHPLWLAMFVIWLKPNWFKPSKVAYTNARWEYRICCVPIGIIIYPICIAIETGFIDFCNIQNCIRIGGI